MSNLELAAISYLQVVCLTFVGSSQQLLTYDDFKSPDFDFSQLEFIGEEKEASDCPGLYYIHKSYLYPTLDEGEVVNDTITTIGVATDRKVDKIYLDDQGLFGEPTFLGERIIQPHLNCKSQDDPDLLQIIKDEYLDAPSVLPYNFQTKQQPMGDGQPMLLDHRYFQETVKGGFFIEAGACNGERDSTTLYFELRHRWSGLLVEPTMRDYKNLRAVNRKAWSVNTCLSPDVRPTTVQFSTAFSSNLTGAGIVESSGEDTIEMQCLPLSSLILALGNPRVDFLSLDIEGAELEVLETILWDRIDIRSISVETLFASEFNSSFQKIHLLLTSQGFLFLDKISRDSVFVQVPRPDFNQPRKNLPTQSRKVSALEMLVRQHFPFPARLCNMFLVPLERMAKHCRIHFPLDYYRDIDVRKLPPCIRDQKTRFDYRSVIGTFELSTPWKTALSDGCLYLL